MKSLLTSKVKFVGPKKRGEEEERNRRRRSLSLSLFSFLALGGRLQEGEEEVVVGGDDEQSGAEVEGDDHAPQVAPGRDAGHGADRRHHVEHLQVKEERNSFQSTQSSSRETVQSESFAHGRESLLYCSNRWRGG